MAQRGTKPQTAQQKAAKGETRPSRVPPSVVEFPLLEKPPKPPSWLSFKASKDLWNDLVGRLMAQRVLTDVDLPALGHLCQMHGEQVDATRRKIAVTAADRNQLRMYFSEFGLTPSSRTRVGAVSGGDKDNRFRRNGRPPAD